VYPVNTKGVTRCMTEAASVCQSYTDMMEAVARASEPSKSYFSTASVQFGSRSTGCALVDV